MNKTSKDDVMLSKHVDDLREKMRLLQADRKVNIDVLESNKAANKEEIRKLREENKNLRVKCATLQRTSASDNDNEERGHIEREVEKLRKGARTPAFRFFFISSHDQCLFLLFLFLSTCFHLHYSALQATMTSSSSLCAFAGCWRDYVTA